MAEHCILTPRLLARARMMSLKGMEKAFYCISKKSKQGLIDCREV